MKKLFFFLLIQLLFMSLCCSAIRAMPVITSFEIACEDTLSAGDTITAVVEGTPGAKVWIMIWDIPLEIYLPEVSPGLYTGVYKLTPHVFSVYRGEVIAHIQCEGMDGPLCVAHKRITILGSSPLFLNLTPSETSTVSQLRPSVSAKIDSRGNKIDTSSFKIFVNGNDVTGSEVTVINKEIITFTPTVDLKEGKNTVYLYGETSDGKDFSVEWDFFIKIPSIESVSHNGDRVIREGDILEVEMTGEPYQKAYFNIGDWKKAIPMNESFRTPGKYVGSYTVQKEDYAVNSPVVCYMELPGGEKITAWATSPVTIMANDLVVVIISPEENQKVKMPFTLKGQTRPVTTVYFEILLTFNIPGVGRVVSPNVITRKTSSNDLGAFECKINLSNVPVNTEYTITATAVDAQGNKSEPHRIILYQE